MLAVLCIFFLNIALSAGLQVALSMARFQEVRVLQRVSLSDVLKDLLRARDMLSVHSIISSPAFGPLFKPAWLHICASLTNPQLQSLLDAILALDHAHRTAVLNSLVSPDCIAAVTVWPSFPFASYPEIAFPPILLSPAYRAESTTPDANFAHIQHALSLEPAVRSEAYFEHWIKPKSALAQFTNSAAYLSPSPHPFKYAPILQTLTPMLYQNANVRGKSALMVFLSQLQQNVSPSDLFMRFITLLSFAVVQEVNFINKRHLPGSASIASQSSWPEFMVLVKHLSIDLSDACGTYIPAAGEESLIGKTYGQLASEMYNAFLTYPQLLLVKEIDILRMLDLFDSLLALAWDNVSLGDWLTNLLACFHVIWPRLGCTQWETFFDLFFSKAPTASAVIYLINSLHDSALKTPLNILLQKTSPAYLNILFHRGELKKFPETVMNHVPVSARRHQLLQDLRAIKSLTTPQCNHLVSIKELTFFCISEAACAAIQWFTISIPDLYTIHVRNPIPCSITSGSFALHYLYTFLENPILYITTGSLPDGRPLLFPSPFFPQHLWYLIMHMMIVLLKFDVKSPFVLDKIFFSEICRGASAENLDTLHTIALDFLQQHRLATKEALAVVKSLSTEKYTLGFGHDQWAQMVTNLSQRPANDADELHDLKGLSNLLRTNYEDGVITTEPLFKQMLPEQNQFTVAELYDLFFN